jgi:hypothetical protein
MFHHLLFKNPGADLVLVPEEKKKMGTGETGETLSSLIFSLSLSF